MDNKVNFKLLQSSMCSSSNITNNIQVILTFTHYYKKTVKISQQKELLIRRHVVDFYNRIFSEF